MAPVSVGIVTALPVEYAAMRLVVEDLRTRTVDDDRNHYQSGWLSSSDPGRPHRVVVTVLPEDGTRNAAAICADLLRSFPSVRCVVMAGIAGGVPAPAAPDRHVRLGDVISATGGVVDFDHVRTVDGADHLRRAVSGLSTDLLRADRELQTGELGGDRPWESWLSGDTLPARFARPPADTDVLRRAGQVVHHPDDGRTPGLPRVHRAAIGSADRLLRDAVRRDALAARHGIRAVEMESSGIAVGAALRSAQWYAVRGIADYCDGAKNDLWHPYAALAAAAYVRSLLGACHPFPGPAAPAPAMTAELSHESLRLIVDALLDIEQLRDEGDRRAFVACLPRGIALAVAHSPRALIHTTAIVRSCAQHRAGRAGLLQALRMIVPEESVASAQAVRLIESLWPDRAQPGE
ncbi:hypothetical protein Lfu02_64580 [Longispora fulva]|nr:hypothetical protein Lfu02_64580 [Longispora fulva]